MKLTSRHSNPSEFDPFPDLNSNPTLKRKSLLPVLLAILALVSASAVYLYYFYSPYKNSPEKPTNFSSNPIIASSPTPASTPKPLPNGRQVYQYSHGKNVLGPKPSQAVIDPIDPTNGQIQTFTLTVSHPSPVTQAAITITHDDGSLILPLELVSGSLTAGQWQATWPANYTYNHRYQIDIKLSDGSSQFEGGLNFR